MKIKSRRYNVANETYKEFYERYQKSLNDEKFFALAREKYWPEYKAAQEKGAK